jgi:hypothetical protein
MASSFTNSSTFRMSRSRSRSASSIGTWLRTASGSGARSGVTLAQHLCMITIRKRRLDQSDKAVDDSAPLDLTRVATIAYSSEDPAHPVEHLVAERTGPGGSRWVAAQPDSVEQIVVEFDRPKSVARLVYWLGVFEQLGATVTPAAG